MATNEPATVPPLPPPSPEHRRIAAESFDKANKVIGTGNFDYGIKLLMTCCKLDPANLMFRQRLRRAQKDKYNNNMRGSSVAFLSLMGLRSKMKNALRKREHLKVLELGEEIMWRNPWDLSAQMDMGAAADALGLSDLAVFMLDQARQKHAMNATLNRTLARLFEKRGNYGHAISLWQKVLEVAPKDLEAQHKSKELAASETIQRGGYDSSEKPAMSLGGAPNAAKGEKKDDKPADRSSREAEQMLGRIQKSPADPNLYVQLAAIYRRYNQPDKARGALEQGLGPTGSHYTLTIEIMELDIEPFRKDLVIVEDKLRKIKKGQASDDDDESPLPKLQQERVRLLKEISAREIELFRTKADRFPGETSNRLELGIRLFQAGQIEQAIEELQRARKDTKYAGKASLYLGLCFKKGNKWAMAQRNFEEALSLLPDSEEAIRKEVLYQLAQGHSEAGDLAKAIELGHDLAHLDFSYKQIGKLIDEWQAKLEKD